MPDDTLIQPPENDGFSHETPKRAFTDWHEQGGIAVARGFRPSVQHLAVYLDALESKEGWQLGQMFLSEGGRPSAAWFRKTGPRVLTVDLDGCMSMEQAERLRDSYRAHYSRPAAMWTDDPYRVLADMLYRIPERERIVAKRPELGMPYGEGEEPLTHLSEIAGPVELTEPMASIAHAFSSITREDIDRYDAERADDPINPRHYGGTACAEIGERLTANCYQVLKYCWRLGEKDDPVQELGKAIWYAERELQLGLPRSRHWHQHGMKQKFVLDRTEDAPWRREIALMLWDMCYGVGTAPHWASTAAELIVRLRAKREEMTPGDARGRGMEP